MVMTKTAVSVTGRVVVAGLLCAVLAGCGTTRAGQAAPRAGAPTLAPADCGADLTTDEGAGGHAGPPTDEETGGYAGPPTDEETGGYAGPPTDEETGGYAGPPTDEETGAHAGPPTDQESGAPAGPPTDGDMTNGGGPCGPADWFDMTREFSAYHRGHRTERDEKVSVTETRVRKVRSVGEARITFSTWQVGKGAAEDARRIAEVFTSWRREVYGDHGTLTLRTAEYEVITQQW
ncbi:hypothetical protein ADK93_20480 [Streptomyces sp. XY58]|jgi:hypothetical protein|nr:hypothetical protein ADK96_04420 [Streptomyces sp. IGB124]KOU86450.1 hypothetical protein ADK93_20480 [Streptomyces sp. XY58]KOV06153.1 hypothetical protein ADK89_16810 [Streptomyces sp. XY37]KOV48501.1 hypothetical protein ADK99_16130 [Streptomyces sp. MMG1064]